MKTPVVTTIVLAIHGMAIGSFLLMQGCTTRSGISARSARTVATASDASATGGSSGKTVAATETLDGSGERAKTVSAPPRVPNSGTMRRPMPPRRPVAVGQAADKPGQTSGVQSRSWTPGPSQKGAVAKPGVGTVGAKSAEGSSVYVVKKGDVLSRIANNHGVSTKELAQFNNLATPDSIRVGQKILIPAHASSPSSGGSSIKSVTQKPSKPAKKMSAGGSSYIVQKGDSLSVIAQRYGTTVSTLRAANQISGDRINVGDKLVIIGATKKPSAGDSAAAVSKSTATKKSPVDIPSVDDVTTSEVAGDVTEKVNSISVPKPNSTKVNPLINSDLGVPPSQVNGGESATPAAPKADPAPVAVPSVTPPAAPKELEQAFEYVVQDGESIDDIARAFIVSVEDVRKLNKLGETEKVRPGQTLKIPPSIF